MTTPSALATALDLRPSTDEHRPFIAELVRQVKGTELAAGGLTGPVLEQLLELQVRAQELHAAAAHRNLESLILYADDEPVGRLLLAVDADRIHLVDIAVLVAWRGRGIGTRLLADLQARAARAGIPVTLEVRKTNPAFDLYQRLGFTDAIDRDLDWHLTWTPPVSGQGEHDDS